MIVVIVMIVVVPMIMVLFVMLAGSDAIGILLYSPRAWQGLTDTPQITDNGQFDGGTTLSKELQ